MMKKTAKNAAATKIVNVPMVIESQNQQYGFWGTTKLNPRVKVAEEWTAAFAWVAQAMPGWSSERIRDFLDGRLGRHLVDEAVEAGGVANVHPRHWREEFLLLAAEVDEKAVPATKVVAIFKAIRSVDSLLSKLYGYRNGLKNYRSELASVDTPEAQAVCRAIDEQLACIKEFAG